MFDLYIKGKHKNDKKFSRLGSQGLVTNVMHCVFFSKEEIERVNQIVLNLTKDNPDFIFKVSRK